MADTQEAQTYVTPGAIVTALLGFLSGGASLDYNPFFATSVIAIALSLVALRRAAKVDHYMVQGFLRIFAIIGIMGGLGGIMVMLFPGLGVTPS